jgi:hypothetical protein
VKRRMGLFAIALAWEQRYVIAAVE